MGFIGIAVNIWRLRFGPPPPPRPRTNSFLFENGNVWITEDGKYLRTEQ